MRSALETEIQKLIKSGMTLTEIKQRYDLKLSFDLDRKLVCFDYRSVSPHTELLVKQARGLILSTEDWSLVAKPMDAFYEDYSKNSKLDLFNWKSAYALPKYRNDFIRSLQDYSDDILIFLNTDIKKVFDLKKILTDLLDGKFIYWEEVTKNIVSNINKRANKFEDDNINYNLLVFKKKKFLALNQKRFIQLCSNNNYTLDYSKNYTGNSLQKQFVGLKK